MGRSLFAPLTAGGRRIAPQKAVLIKETLQSDSSRCYKSNGCIPLYLVFRSCCLRGQFDVGRWRYVGVGRTSPVNLEQHWLAALKQASVISVRLRNRELLKLCNKWKDIKRQN